MHHLSASLVFVVGGYYPRAPELVCERCRLSLVNIVGAGQAVYHGVLAVGTHVMCTYAQPQPLCAIPLLALLTALLTCAL